MESAPITTTTKTFWGTTGTVTKWYNKAGKLHRTDGPAAEYTSGNKYWYINGKLHREDGPAIEYISGIKEWFINGEELTEDEFNKRMNAGLLERF